MAFIFAVSSVLPSGMYKCATIYIVSNVICVASKKLPCSSFFFFKKWKRTSEINQRYPLWRVQTEMKMQFAQRRFFFHRILTHTKHLPCVRWYYEHRRIRRTCWISDWFLVEACHAIMCCLLTHRIRTAPSETQRNRKLNKTQFCFRFYDFKRGSIYR